MFESLQRLLSKGFQFLSAFIIVFLVSFLRLNRGKSEEQIVLSNAKNYQALLSSRFFVYNALMITLLSRKKWQSRASKMVRGLVLFAYLWSAVLPSGVMPRVGADGQLSLSLCGDAGTAAERAAVATLLASVGDNAPQDLFEEHAPDEPVLDERCLWSLLVHSEALGFAAPVVLSHYVGITISTLSRVPTLERQTISTYSARGPPSFFFV